MSMGMTKLTTGSLRHPEGEETRQKMWNEFANASDYEENLE
jgi:hypothetical protein